MTATHLLLKLPKEQIFLVDFYTKSKGIPRVTIFRELLNSRIIEHKAEIRSLGASMTGIIENKLLSSNKGKNAKV